MEFRTDINGLRAYAVLAVIIFHFNKQWLSGGFAGVDVFFVISGYLMTSIIFRGLANNSFSIWKFYAARIKRIIPALLALVIVLMVFGYLFLGPIPYADLAKHSGGSLLFISNILYWKESGYFDASALEKFLLHTWSLSVEWQFYIIYPIGLLLLSKLLKLEIIKKIFVAGTIIALIFSIYASQRWSVASYFLLPTRMWEMLLGGIAFLYPFELKKQSDKHILELSGLGLIVVSFFIITENTIWPGYAALIPTLGTFILIQANNDKSIFTNNIICQKIGLWSYSLYLWHWSLLATYNYFGYKIKIWPFLFVTLACGITSYYLIEKRKWNIRIVIFAILISLTAILGVYQTNGAASRVDPKFNLTEQEFHRQYYGGYGFPVFTPSTLGYDKQSITNTIIMGDSYSWQYAKYVNEYEKSIQSFFGDGCMFLKDYSSSYRFNDCAAISDDFYSRTDNSNKTIIWAQNWQYQSAINKKDPGATRITYVETPKLYLDIVEQSINYVSSSVQSIYIIGSPFRPTYHPFKCLSENFLIGSKMIGDYCQTEIEYEPPEINNHLRRIIKKYKNIYFIDPNDVLCKNNKCTLIINDEPLFSDTHHLSIYGAEIVGKYIFDKIREIENVKTK